MPDTSPSLPLFCPRNTRAAARPGPRRAETDRQRVLKLLIERGSAGATDAEIAAVLKLPPDSAKPRRVELRQLGLVIDSGLRRPTPTGHLATVWCVRTAAHDAQPKPVTDTPSMSIPAEAADPDETIKDPELMKRIHALPAAQRAFWERQVAARRARGERLAGLGWRALVDTRLEFGWPQ